MYQISVFKIHPLPDLAGFISWNVAAACSQGQGWILFIDVNKDLGLKAKSKDLDPKATVKD